MSTFITIITVLVPALLALYFILKPKQTSLNIEKNKKRIALIENLKLNSNRYVLEFDNCQFKDSSYLSEVELNNPNYQLASFAIGANAPFYTPVERVETLQSVLFYSDKNIANEKRFYQTFPMDQTTLKYHVLKGNLILYIDKNEINKYFFELIEK